MRQMQLHESETIRLGDLCDLVIGRTPKRENLDNFGGNHIWVSIGDMNNKYVEDSKEKLTDKGVKEAHARLISEGTLLLSFKLSLGKVAIARKPLYTNEAIVALIPRKRVNVNYLYYYLRQINFSRYGRKAVKGLCLNKEILSKIELGLVPLETQDKIVSILEKAEQLKKWRNESDRLTQNYLYSVFGDMFGDPKTNPMGWKVTNFGKLIVDIRYGTSIKCNPEKKGITVLRIPNVINGVIELSDLKYAELQHVELERFTVTEGDMLFVRTNGNREYVGRSAVFHESNGMYAFASYLIRARLSEDLDSTFAKIYLRLPYARKQLFQNARTSAGQYNINTNGLKAVKFILPPINLQRKFASLARRIEYLVEKQKQSQREIDKLFKSLVERAFGGKIFC